MSILIGCGAIVLLLAFTMIYIRAMMVVALKQSIIEACGYLCANVISIHGCSHIHHQVYDPYNPVTAEISKITVKQVLYI